MPTPTKKTTLYEVFGGNLREMRKSRGWSQDQLARRAREEGLSWSRSSVAAVEAGRKTLDLTEVVLVTVAVGGGLPELLAGDGEAALSQLAQMSLESIRSILSGDDPISAVTTADKTLAKLASQVKTRDKVNARRRATLPPYGEAEQKAARKLGVSVELLAETSFRLWGHSLTDEREARVGPLSRSDSITSLRALRGRVTRQLLADLEPQLVRRRKSER